MKARIPVLGALVALLLACMSAGASAQVTEPELEFVAPEAVTASLSDDTSDAVSVWVKNSSSRSVMPTFEAVLEDSDGNAASASVDMASKAKPAGPGKVARFRLVLDEASKSSGQLVATADGLAPASVKLSVGPELALSRGVDGALIFPFIAAFLLVGVAWLLARKVADSSGMLGTAELEFSKAFASTLTTVGAVLATIIAASVLPEETVNISKAGFVGLNLTFALAIPVAGIVYAAVQKAIVEEGSGSKKEWKLKGYTVPFLLAALITVWAVFGEIWTMWRIFEELGRGQGFSEFGVWLVRFLLGFAVLAMIPYTIVRVRAALRKPPTQDAPAVAVAEEPRTVSLL